MEPDATCDEGAEPQQRGQVEDVGAKCHPDPDRPVPTAMAVTEAVISGPSAASAAISPRRASDIAEPLLVIVRGRGPGPVFSVQALSRGTAPHARATCGLRS